MIDIKASRAGSRDEKIMVRSSPSSPIAILSVAAALTVLAAPARPGPAINAPWLAPPGSGPALTEDDVARMQAAVARLNEGRSIGTVERWRSQTSRTAGEVTLARRFVAQGMSCHTIHYVIRYQNRPDSPRRFVFNWCRQPDHAWKIVELGG